MRKRILTILLCGVMVLGIVGCQNKSEKETLESVNNKIIEYFQTNGVQDYENFVFNYVDKENNVVIVGLLNNSEEEQEKFRKIVVDSKLLKFVQGEKSQNFNNAFKLVFKEKPGNIKKQIIDKNTSKQYDYNVYVWNGDVDIIMDNNAYSLEDALNNNKITMDEIISQANKDIKEPLEANDGGSKVYKYDTYTIIKLHTIRGNRDVYIGNKNLSLDDIK